MFFGVHYQDQEGRTRLGSIIGFSIVTDASPGRSRNGEGHQSMLGPRVEGPGIPSWIGHFRPFSCQILYQGEKTHTRSRKQ